MAHVVFLRGANVGGARSFRPSTFAQELDVADAVSIGAAGTFVVRGEIDAEALHRQIRERLPFEARIMIREADEILRLLADDPLAAEAAAEGTRRYVSVLAGEPSAEGKARLPLVRPDEGPWQLRVCEVRGPFVLSLRRRTEDRPLYPNAAVEKELDVEATTRTWTTLEKVGEKLA